MLFLVFRIGQERYIIKATNIAAVIPLLKTHKITGVPDYIAGVINYKGHTIPVVDLSKLIAGKKSKPRLSTRIVLVDYVIAGERYKTLGFIAEKATEIVKLHTSDFSVQNISSDVAPYLGSIANDSEGMLQKIDIHQLIDLKIRDYLDFKAA